MSSGSSSTTPRLSKRCLRAGRPGVVERAVFYFDLGSPYAYLAAERVNGLFAEGKHKALHYVEIEPGKGPESHRAMSAGAGDAVLEPPTHLLDTRLVTQVDVGHQVRVHCLSAPPDRPTDHA